VFVNETASFGILATITIDLPCGWRAADIALTHP
jgi:hypothetical protein